LDIWEWHPENKKKFCTCQS